MAKMAKTSAERVAAFRKRQKVKDPTAFREKERLTKAKWTAGLNIYDKKAHLAKKANANRRCHTAKRKKNLDASIMSSGELSTVSPNSSGYAQKQSLSRAVNRLRRQLPESPRKRRAVVRQLAISTRGCEVIGSERFQRRTPVITTVIGTDRDFFQFDAVAYQAP